MSTLAEVEAAVAKLSVEELAELEIFIRRKKHEQPAPGPRSIPDMKPSNLGRMLRPLGTREEWYNEMREDQK